MSVEKYFGEPTPSSAANLPGKLKEAVENLIRHAPVTIDETVADTTTDYAVILRISADRYAKVRAAKDGDNGVVEFSTGYKSGSYVPLRSVSGTYGGGSFTTTTEVDVVNGGDLWELYFPVHYRRSVENLYARFTLRGSMIVSSIDGAEYYAVGVSNNEYYNYNDYPLIDGLMFWYEGYDPREYMLSCSDPDTAHNNVGEGMLLLFPSLLCAPGPFQTGAAMIGNQSTFFMSCRATDPISRYEEFVLNRQRFVSLGRLAIRSR